MITKKRVIIAFAVLACLPWFVHLMQAPASTEAGAGASNWDAYLTLLRNIPHLMAEGTAELVPASIGYLFARKVWKKKIHDHDVEVHGLDCEVHPHQ